ncbi:hypothetical protein SAMN05421776_13018 [Nocardia farcinica]|uniref:DUF2637 domain-containing protein n=1 Tax=Nocardia farcinica TaxID=37329 RepID=A0A0H5PBP0_NOCFR|nr:hypothetical protein [Nocardia farcinica]AXK90055.1 hypothetical protein DXT66_30150 [Nocardia farcinica]PFW98518.1 hypothetical protein CJ469_06164 [Nocardia farcinica]PFX02621.1 hypothetical protein CJ468_05873 [Nocardia farcinica]CRY84664.1 Uncharacterised protein [Nocardia farcinica]SIT34653.1 hypothetical protein SAMN05421776_13018 [Nocardia farcinica]
MTPDHTPAEAVARKAKDQRSAKIERSVTLFTAGIASIVAAQGMYVMFSESLHMHPALQALCFAFIELMVVASAMRARRSQIDTGSAGVDGIAMWVLTILSGVLAASHATNDVGLLVLRLAAPLVAAWGWERSMALERRQLTGRAGGMTLRWTPQRLLVKWGIADPTDRTVAEVAVERRLADLALAADAVRIARINGSGGRAERKAMQRLHRAIDKAADDGVVLGEDSVRDRLAEHLEGRFSAYTLPDYRPVTDWADHTARAPRPTLDTIESDPAVRAEIAALEREVERELTARATAPLARGDEDHAPVHAAESAIDRAREAVAGGEDESRASDPVDRASIARGPIARSRADIGDGRAGEDAVSIAGEVSAARADASVERAESGSEAESIAREVEVVDRAPIVAQTGPELDTDRDSRADHTPEEQLSNARPGGEERASVARATEGVDRDRRAVVSIARDPKPVSPIAREDADRARPSRAGRARSTVIEGALARATEPAPRARLGGHGPFDRALSRAEATVIARAVVDRKLSRKSVEELTAIYEAASAGATPNAIGATMGLPHSTVGRALEAATKVSGPRLV